MRHKSMNVIVFVVLIVSLLGTSWVYSAEMNLRLVYSNVEFFPYQMGNGYAIPDPPGIAVELIAQAAKELGLNIKFVRRPNKRVLKELRDGDADGVFLFSFNKARLKYGQYPMNEGKIDNRRRITTVSYYIYKQKDSPLDWNGNQFTNLDGVLGGNRGYSIVDDLRKKGIKIEEVNTTEQNLKKLQIGRIEGYAAQDITTDPHVDSSQYGEIVKLSTPLATKDYFLMLSHQFMKQHSDTAERLWNKVGALRESVIKELAPKYKSVTE